MEKDMRTFLRLFFKSWLCIVFSWVVHCPCIINMWWSGVVGVAGTQHRTRANERPQQAAYSSYRIFFFFFLADQTSTKPAWMQQTHAAKHTQCARAAKKASKQCNRNRSSKQPNQQNLYFLGRLQLWISLKLQNQLSQIIYQMKA